MSYMRETHDSSCESCVKVITLFDIIIMSYTPLHQSWRMDDLPQPSFLKYYKLTDLIVWNTIPLWLLRITYMKFALLSPNLEDE